MHETVRRCQLAAVSDFAMQAALRGPSDLTEATLDRVDGWRRAIDAPPWQLRAAMAGKIVKRETLTGFPEIGAEVENAKLVRVEEPLGRRTFRFERELLALPDGFEAHCSKAHEIHLVFGTAIGGDSGVCLDAITILTAAVERGAKVSAHVEEFAASADADMFVLIPGRRTMAPTARLLLHQAHSAVFGDAAQLREAAAELERFEVGHVARMARRTNQPLDVVKSWYLPAADVTFDAKAAVGCRLCDGISEGQP